MDIKSDKEWETAMEESCLREELAPPGGWLTLACFHVLWSSGSVKLMPRIADLVPMHPWVKFLNAKADCRGMDAIAKQVTSIFVILVKKSLSSNPDSDL